eukprot:6191397-Pleurochrysis_carterae.AAC.3
MPSGTALPTISESHGLPPHTQHTSLYMGFWPWCFSLLSVSRSIAPFFVFALHVALHVAQFRLADSSLSIQFSLAHTGTSRIPQSPRLVCFRFTLLFPVCVQLSSKIAPLSPLDPDLRRPVFFRTFFICAHNPCAPALLHPLPPSHPCLTMPFSKRRHQASQRLGSSQSLLSTAISSPFKFGGAV